MCTWLPGGGGKELLVAGEAACTHTRTRGGERGMGERETHTGRERETHRGGERENETERERVRERDAFLCSYSNII